MYVIVKKSLCNYGKKLLYTKKMLIFRFNSNNFLSLYPQKGFIREMTHSVSLSLCEIKDVIMSSRKKLLYNKEMLIYRFNQYPSLLLSLKWFLWRAFRWKWLILSLSLCVSSKIMSFKNKDKLSIKESQENIEFSVSDHIFNEEAKIWPKLFDMKRKDLSKPKMCQKHGQQFPIISV